MEIKYGDVPSEKEIKDGMTEVLIVNKKADLEAW
jgi:hypothetical protein